jgi:predicted transcriptional regulator of viral defense system
MDVQGFFARNPVFTIGEFASYVQSGSKRTPDSLLRYHTQKGRLLRVRRGLYAVVPAGFDPASYQVGPYLLASKMADDALLGYHTALQFYGKAYSSSSQYLYLTKHATRVITFRANEFRGVRFPKQLCAKGKEFFGVETHERAGIPVRVTSPERTLVDVLDRPDLGGGWEEIWRSLEAVEFFDLDAVVEYALLLENATTAAKVGFFLEQHRNRLMVEEAHLAALRAHRPRSPHYMARTTRESGRWIPEWRLVVPPEILERGWEEVL